MENDDQYEDNDTKPRHYKRFEQNPIGRERVQRHCIGYNEECPGQHQIHDEVLLIVAMLVDERSHYGQVELDRNQRYSKDSKGGKGVGSQFNEL